jgi:hypothetical protein
LGSNAQPILSAIRLDLNEAWVLNRLVNSDFFDGTAITSGARIGYHNAVLGGVDLSYTLEFDFDGHGGLFSSVNGRIPGKRVGTRSHKVHAGCKSKG